MSSLPGMILWFPYTEWSSFIAYIYLWLEAKLAREAEISYAVVCLVTDYDCWRENGAHVTVSHVLQTLNQNTANAKSLLLAVLPHLERGLKGTGRGAVVKGMNKFAVITAKEKRNDNQVQSLEFLLPGYY